jgi:hypothetical protein
MAQLHQPRLARHTQDLPKHIATGLHMQRTKVAEGPAVWAIRPHKSDKGQVALTGRRNLAARKHPHAVGIQQQADHHRRVKRGSPPGFILIRRIETTPIQLGHHSEQEADHIARRQLGVRALGFLPVTLGLPGPIRFPLGLAHHRSPRVYGTKGCLIGRKHDRPSSDQRQLSMTKSELFRTGS